MHNIPEGICVAMPIYYATGSKWKVGCCFCWLTPDWCSMAAPKCTAPQLCGAVLRFGQRNAQLSSNFCFPPSSVWVQGFTWAFLSGVSEPIGGLVGYLVLNGNNDLSFAIVFGLVAGGWSRLGSPVGTAVATLLRLPTAEPAQGTGRRRTSCSHMPVLTRVIELPMYCCRHDGGHHHQGADPHRAALRPPGQCDNHLRHPWHGGYGSLPAPLHYLRPSE